MAREKKLSLLIQPFAPYWSIGLRIASPLGCTAAAEPRSSERLKPWPDITQNDITAPPEISMTALIICTQVVPFIPPMST